MTLLRSSPMGRSQVFYVAVAGTRMDAMKDHVWHEGGCFCGAVRYQVRGPAVWKAGCTCNTCVKMHTAPYVVWAGFDKANYELIKGEPVRFRSSPHVIREFCGVCGSTLIYGKDAAGVPELMEAARIVYVAVASLDDPNAYPPDEVVHGQERIDWLRLAEDIPMREFVSPKAGHLQFGGIEQSDPTKGGKRPVDRINKQED